LRATRRTLGKHFPNSFALSHNASNTIFGVVGKITSHAAVMSLMLIEDASAFVHQTGDVCGLEKYTPPNPYSTFAQPIR
jgi:hypothetical protein